MTALETIAAKAWEKGLRFLVIGAHAVMAHGFARSTYDLDLLVKAAEQEQWKALLKELGAIVHSADRSLRTYTVCIAEPSHCPKMPCHQAWPRWQG